MLQRQVKMRRKTTATCALTVAEPLGRCRSKRPLHQLIFFFVANYMNYVRERSVLLGSARRVAAGNDDFRGRIVSRDAPDGLPGTLIGTGGEWASVDDHQVG